MSVDTIIEQSDFGSTLYGDKAQLFTLQRKGGLIACITNFGGIITQLQVPDKQNNYFDVVLGFNSIDEYIRENIYAGAIVGRISGRVTGSGYTVDEKAHSLTNNYADYHVHGGTRGFDKQLWKAEIIKSENDDNVLQLSYFSADGEEGYPGNVNVTVVYSLTKEGGLRIDFKATTDKATPISLTNHSYFNLSGEATTEGHIIQIDADRVIEVNEMLLPTGNIQAVEKTSNDFRDAALLRERLPLLFLQHGDNYLLQNNGSFNKVARISSGDGKRNIQVFTTAPNLQFYTGAELNTTALGKKGLQYKKYAGICFECQGFSDAMNHKGFKSILLEPGDIFEQSTEYRFGEA